MACASLLAGFAMNLSEAGTEHSLAHALGARHGLPHGLTVGLLLAESLDHDRRYVPEIVERAADALGAPPSATADGSRAVTAVRRLLAELEFPTLRASASARTTSTRSRARPSAPGSRWSRGRGRGGDPRSPTRRRWRSALAAERGAREGLVASAPWSPSS